MYNHGNNASQAAQLSGLETVLDATVGFSTPCSDPSSLVYTKSAQVCSCWRTSGERGHADFEALKNLAERDPQLQIDSSGGGQELVFTLPLEEQVDKNKAQRLDAAGNVQKGKQEALRRGMRRRQAAIVACVCGRLTNQPLSRIMAVLRDRHAAQQALADAAAAPEDSSAKAADEMTTGGSGTDAPGTEEDAPPAGAAASRRRRPDNAAAACRSVPPLWLLLRCSSHPAAYAAAHAVTPGGPEPAPAMVDAALRRHISVLRVFLMRTRTTQVARWTVGAKVDPVETVKAAETMVERLAAMHVHHLPLVGGCEPMELWPGQGTRSMCSRKVRGADGREQQRSHPGCASCEQYFFVPVGTEFGPRLDPCHRPQLSVCGRLR